MTAESKVYLGDGAYAAIEHGELVLTTEDGIRTTNRIVLGPVEWNVLKEFIERSPHVPAPGSIMTR